MANAPPSPDLPPPDEAGPPAWAPVASNALLFLLVAGLAATIDLRTLRSRERQVLRGIAIAMLCQFVILPFAGFAATRVFQLERVYGVMLQAVVSSPGGAYSNLWCSLGNADLALSVTATALSTILAAAFLPLNLFIYLHASYGSSILEELRWDLMLLTIGIVTVAVGVGLLFSWRLQRGSDRGRRQRAETIRWRCNLLGNVAGLALIAFSLVFSSSREPLWDKPPRVYAATALPTLVAVVATLALTSLPCARLARPERVAITIECLYQNTGLATSIALSIFDGAEAAKAVSAPLLYGFFQTAAIPLLVLVWWKAGWTYAPPSEPLLRFLRDNYQDRAGRAGEAGAEPMSDDDMLGTAAIG